MREIKFRIWNSAASFMEPWSEIVRLKKINLISNQNPSYPTMQFTGLTDKNGNEIYEGDLIENQHGRTSEVVWHKFTASFDSKFVSDDGSAPPYQDKSHGFHNASWRYEVEVVGNIYSNPELLKAGE